MNQALASVIYVLIFIAIIAAVQGVADILFSSRDRTKRTNRRLSMLASGMDRSEVYAALIRSPVGAQSQNVLWLRFYNKFALHYQQAGLEGSPLRVLSFVGVASVALWLLSLLLLRNGSFAGLIL